METEILLRARSWCLWVRFNDSDCVISKRTPLWVFFESPDWSVFAFFCLVHSVIPLETVPGRPIWSSQFEWAWTSYDEGYNEWNLSLFSLTCRSEHPCCAHIQFGWLLQRGLSHTARKSCKWTIWSDEWLYQILHGPHRWTFSWASAELLQSISLSGIFVGQLHWSWPWRQFLYPVTVHHTTEHWGNYTVCS